MKGMMDGVLLGEEGILQGNKALLYTVSNLDEHNKEEYDAVVQLCCLFPHHPVVASSRGLIRSIHGTLCYGCRSLCASIIVHC